MPKPLSLVILRLLSRYGTKGFSLIEIMIAIAIFSIGILAVASMQTNGVRSMTAARQRLCNTTAAAGRLELALMAAFDAPEWQKGAHGPFDLPQSSSTITWEVVEAFPITGAKRIRVTVYRPARDGRRHAHTFDYLKVRDL